MALIGYENRVLSGTVTAGSEQAGLTVGNLQNQHGSPAFAWRTAAGVLSSWFQVDAASIASTWRAFALCRTNLTAAATWRVRVAASSSMASPVYDSGTVPANVAAGIGQAVLATASPVVSRYCRIDIADAGNPDGFLSVPLAFAGPAWRPAVNFSPDSAFGLANERQAVRTRSGGAFFTPLWTERSWNLAFNAVLSSELWSQLVPAQLAAADGRNILFAPDHAGADAPREAVFGPLETVADIGFATLDGNRRNWRARIVERL